MRQFISNTVAALAKFIEIDASIELGVKNGAINLLGERLEIERERTEALERYARAWVVQPRTTSYEDDYAAAKTELLRATRVSRRKAERVRQESRRNARKAKEMLLAY